MSSSRSSSESFSAFEEFDENSELFLDGHQYSSLEDIYNSVQSALEEAIKKESGWANVKIDTAIKLHDILLQLRHWGSDFRSHEGDNLDLVESKDTDIAEVVRGSLIDVIRDVHKLQKFFEKLETEDARQTSSTTEVEEVLLQNIIDSAACVLLQVDPLRTFFDVHAKTGMPGAVVEAVSALKIEPEKGNNELGEEIKEPEPEPEEANELVDMLLSVSHRNFEGRRFWPLKDLRRVMTSSRVRKALNEKLPLTEKSNIGIYTSRILGENDQYRQGFLKIFAMLTLMEKFERIGSFIAEGFDDGNLPIYITEPQQRKAVLVYKDGSDLAMRPFEGWKYFEIEFFCDIQWQFNVPYFDFDHNGLDSAIQFEFEKETILPWREQIQTFTSAFPFMEQFQIDPSCYHLSSDRLLDASIAVKTLRSHEISRFQNEVDALNIVGQLSNDHVIRLLATYEFRNNYHLVFPGAGCNLEQYWQMHSGPLMVENNPDDKWLNMRWVSAQMCGIVKAIAAMHNYNSVSISGAKTYYLMHGSLSPKRIIWQASPKDSQGTLVINDFEYAQLSRNNARQPEVLAIYPRISPEYRPPECDIALRRMTRSIDIWGLGCIFLEMACWLLGGYDLRRSFQKVRESPESTGFVSYRIFDLTLAPEGKHEEEGRHFFSLKDSVYKFFEKLRAHHRCSPYVYDLLDLIQDDMLVMQRKRIKSIQLKEEIKRLHSRVEQDLDYAVTPDPLYYRRAKRSGPSRTRRLEEIADRKRQLLS